MAATKTDTVRSRKRRKPGDLGQLRRVLWTALLRLEETIHEADMESSIKAANALANMARAYLSANEQADLEARITALEDQIHIRSQENGRANVSIVR